MSVRIEDLDAPGGLAAARELFRAYADWLETAHAIPAETHGIDEEIARLPGVYAPPDGALLGARIADGSCAGCIALRRLDAATCEVKRLYVRPEARGLRIGEALIAALVGQARSLGYARVMLDVGDYQGPARSLYAKCGFAEIAPEDHISYPGVVFMALDL